MRPILFYWRGRPIHSYPAMLYVGLVAAVTAGNLAAHAVGLDAFRVYVATVLLIVPALVGARLLHVGANWRAYRRDVRRIWNRSEGGYSMYGGLPLALLASVPVLYLLHLPLGAFWDVGIISILTGMVFARIGCLLNGCCAGRASNRWFSLYLPNHSGVWRKRVPSQLLESAWAVVLLVSALAVRGRMPFDGALFLSACCAYAGGRLVLETLREPARGSSQFNLHHAISATIIVLALVGLSVNWPR